MQSSGIRVGLDLLLKPCVDVEGVVRSILVAGRLQALPLAGRMSLAGDELSRLLGRRPAWLGSFTWQTAWHVTTLPMNEEVESPSGLLRRRPYKEEDGFGITINVLPSAAQFTSSAYQEE